MRATTIQINEAVDKFFEANPLTNAEERWIVKMYATSFVRNYLKKQGLLASLQEVHSAFDSRMPDSMDQLEDIVDEYFNNNGLEADAYINIYTKAKKYVEQKLREQNLHYFPSEIFYTIDAMIDVD